MSHDVGMTSFVQVFDGNSGSLLTNLCGPLFELHPNIEGYSEVVRVVFKTDGSVSHRGWALHWTSELIKLL